MKKLLFLFTWIALLSGSALAQTGPLTVTDNTVTCYNCRKIVFGSITVSGTTATVAGGGGSGTVTSVAQSFTGGLISVAGSPVTTSGTLALTVAGTSGGIPYFSSGSTWASSAALAANALVIGGGAGVAPSTTTTAAGILTFLGTPSSANFFSAITNETGTGLVMGNDTPTIITPSFTTGFTIGGVAATGTIPRGNGTNFVASAFTMAAPGTTGNVLTSDGTNWTSAAPAGGTPGGSDTQLQRNNAGAFGGISGATSDGTNVTFGSGNLLATSPRITTGINDANGNESILLTATASAVNEWTATNAATGGTVTLAATGSDTNIPINIWAKGTAAAAIAKFGTTGGWQLQVSNSIGFRVATVDAGTSSHFNVTAGWARVSSGMGIGWSSSSTAADSGPDAFFMRSAAAHIRMGNSDAASPVAQTLSVQNVVAGTSNTAGAAWTFNGSRGTGTGTGGALIWQIAPAGGSGTTQNSLVEAMRINGEGAYIYPSTVTAGGTTGDRTINKVSGTVNFAAAASAITVTNSLVTANSLCFAEVRTNDSTATIKNVVPTSGSFTINLGAAATAETSVGFFCINQ